MNKSNQAPTQQEKQDEWLDENLLKAAGYEDYEIKQMQECDELDNIEEDYDED